MCVRAWVFMTCIIGSMCKSSSFKPSSVIHISAIDHLCGLQRDHNIVGV